MIIFEGRKLRFLPFAVLEFIRWEAYGIDKRHILVYNTRRRSEEVSA